MVRGFCSSDSPAGSSSTHPQAQPSTVSHASHANLRGPILYRRPAIMQKK